jgi:hypothetical protein
MKTTLCFVLLTLVAPAFGAGPVKEKKPLKASLPTAAMEGYADWDTWVLMSESASDAKYYVKRMINQPGNLDFWLKVEERKPPECTPTVPTATTPKINPFLQSPYESLISDPPKRSCENDYRDTLGSTVTHVVFACKVRKAKYLESVSYNQVGESLGSNEGKNKWVAVFPDTVMDSLFNRLCAGAL